MQLYDCIGFGGQFCSARSCHSAHIDTVPPSVRHRGTAPAPASAGPALACAPALSRMLALTLDFVCALAPAYPRAVVVALALAPTPAHAHARGPSHVLPAAPAPALAVTLGLCPKRAPVSTTLTARTAMRTLVFANSCAPTRVPASAVVRGRRARECAFPVFDKTTECTHASSKLISSWLVHANLARSACFASKRWSPARAGGGVLLVGLFPCLFLHAKYS